MLVSHRYPGVFLTGCSLSCLSGDQRAWPLGTVRSSVRIKVLQFGISKYLRFGYNNDVSIYIYIYIYICPCSYLLVGRYDN